MGSVTLAATVFATSIAFAKAEDELIELLWRLYGERGHSEFTFDHYDESIEVYGCTPTAAAFDGLRDAGFARIWQHAHPEEDRDRCGCRATRPE